MKTSILKYKRKENGLTQLEIAKKANITERAYQRYESGERLPNVCTAQLIAQALNTTVEELFPLSQENGSSNTNLVSKE